jgi:hypothetical protein
MKRKTAANRETTVKPKGKPRGKPFTGKDDPRNNLAGRPKDGESWGAILKVLGNMNSEELAAMVGGKKTDLGRQFLQMPKGVQMKYLVSLRAFTALMFDPSASLWNSLMERVEGKVPDTVNLGGQIRIDQYKTLIEGIYGPATEPEGS